MNKQVLIGCCLFLLLPFLGISQHFQVVWEDLFQPMNVLVTSTIIYGESLSVGDEIGVFDGNICVGSVIVSDESSTDYYSIITSGNDPTNPGIDGFISDNPITYRIWDSSANVEYTNLIPLYSLGDGFFEPLGTKALSLSITSNITCSLDDASTCPGSVSMPITVDGFDEVESFNLRINYNVNELLFEDYSNVNASLLTNGSISVTASNGVVYINWTGTSPINLGNNSLLDLNFIAQSFTETINSELNWNNNSVININGIGSIPANYLSAEIQIQALPQTPELITYDEFQCITDAYVEIFIESIPNATSYEWNLTTIPAGSLSESETEATLSWESDFIGQADIIVNGNNQCGIGPVLHINPNRNPLPQAEIGNDTIICSDQSINLSGIASVYSDIEWVTMGAGSFLNASTLNPTYITHADDIDAGSVEIGLRAFPLEGCNNNAYATQIISFQIGANTFAGNDTTICYLENLQINSASIESYSSMNWITNGNGSFDDNNALDPMYFPSPEDIANGSVTLNLIATPISPCEEDIEDSFVLSFATGPEIVMQASMNVCETETEIEIDYIVYAQNQLTWFTNGSGTFTEITAIGAVYHPSEEDVLSGTVFLTLNAESTDICIATTSETIQINFQNSPEIEMTEYFNICEGNSIALNPNVLNASNVQWETNGSGNFENAFNSAANTYIPSINDVQEGVVTLTLTAFPLIPCLLPTSKSCIIHLNENAMVNAGPDFGLCVDVNEIVLETAQVENAVNLLWTTNGSGSFVDETILNATYIPSTEDLDIILSFTLTGESITPCSDIVSDEVSIVFATSAIVDAGEDIESCSGSAFIILDQAVAENYSQIEWTTNGSGEFVDDHSLDTEYIISSNDMIQGEIEIYLSATAFQPCTDIVRDTLILFVAEAIELVPGSDGGICEIEAFELTAEAQNYASVLWTTTGSGIIDDSSSLNTFYTPSEEDMLQDIILFALDITPIFPCAQPESAEIILFISPSPEITMPNDYMECRRDEIPIGAEVNYGEIYAWQDSNGDGFVFPTGLLNTDYYPSGNDFNKDSIELILTVWNIECQTTTKDTVLLRFYDQGFVFAGEDQSICEGEPIFLEAYAENYETFLWSHGSQDGVFEDEFALSTLYYPGPEDIINGSVTLSSTIINDGYICDSSFDLIEINITPTPYVDLGIDQLCFMQDTVWIYPLYSNYEELIWVYNGDGNIIDENNGIIGYQPGNQDLLNGYGELILNIIPLMPCVEEVVDTVRVYVNTTDIQTISKQMDIFPNPATNQINIKLPNIPTSNTHLYIYDISGKLMKEIVLGNSTNINISIFEIPEGIYLLKLCDKQSTFYSKLVIKK